MKLFLLLTAVSAAFAKDDSLVFRTPMTNESQRISILVGRASQNDLERPGIGPMAEGDEGGGSEDGEGGGGPLDVVSAGYEWCRTNRCCYQFTWQGYIQEIPTVPDNATCAHLKKEKKDDGMACFDPIVYTTGGGSFTAPNINELLKLAEIENFNIFCPLTKDKSCVALKYYSRSGGKAIVNETRFCGSITETNSGSRITSGCYSQNVQGYIREVCACDNSSYCNTSRRVVPIPLILVYALIFYK